MLKRIIGLAIVSVILLTLTVGGTWAYFSDTGKSGQNFIKASQLTMLTGISPDGGVTVNYSRGLTQSLNVSNLKPSQSTQPITIYLKNETTSINGSSVNISFQYTKVTTPNTDPPMSADSTAAIFEVTTLVYNRTQNFLLGGLITDWNGNGYIDMQDLMTATNSPNSQMNGLAGLQAGLNKQFSIQLKMRSEAQQPSIDQFQGDGLNITMYFTLNQ